MPETSSHQGHHTAMKALSMKDRVKIAFFEHYIKTRDLYKECLDRMARGKAPKYEQEFNAEVIAMALDVLPKLDFEKNAEAKKKFAPIREITSAELNMPFEKAEELFRLEREFLEINGITEYEYSHTPAALYTMKGAGRQ
jgi:hypothetical protein